MGIELKVWREVQDINVNQKGEKQEFLYSCPWQKLALAPFHSC